MNILIPDSWLREYLVTKATPKQLKEYLSLCGPSIERVNAINGDTVYDIEVTSNRPDSMSVVGIAREAAGILPRFGIPAKLVNDPYQNKKHTSKPAKYSKKLFITADTTLCPRWTSVVIDSVTVGPSPAWLTKKLEATGIRSLNNVVDITNYLMRAYGQPAHAFDYDQIAPKNGRPAMTLRASRKGEKLTTLDGKTHTLPGGDIVIEDGSGKLIDLCGIMGGENSSIKLATKTIVLFMQTYDPVRIRKTSMSLAHRTEAASLFEKGLDSQLVMPTIIKGIELVTELTGGHVASQMYDIYPQPYKPYTVSVSRKKVDAYLGAKLSDKEIKNILQPLGFATIISGEVISVLVPSFRRDIAIDVDIIEEIARIHGYHNIQSTLPDTSPPMTMIDPALTWEQEIKTRLRDWGYTETFTYSMISKKLMDIFEFNAAKTYTIANPLSEEWVYMRPSLLPSILAAIEQNQDIQEDLKLFELSMVYLWNTNNLPKEKPMVVVALSGEKYREAKGIAEAIFDVFGIEMPVEPTHTDSAFFDPKKSVSLGAFGTVGQLSSKVLESMKIKRQVTAVELDFEKLVASARHSRSYMPIPKNPPIIEDLSLVVSSTVAVGSLISVLKKQNPLVFSVHLLDAYKDTRTFRITYLDPTRTLTNDDIKPIREKLIHAAQSEFGATLKV